MLGSYHGIEAQVHRSDVTFKGRFGLPGTLTATFDMGPARPDRIVVVAGFQERDASSTTPVPTINGVAMSVVGQPTLSDAFGLFWAIVPSGTSATVTFPSNTQEIMAWVITGLQNGLYSSTGGSCSGTYSASMSAPPQQGVVVEIGRSRTNSSSASVAAVSGLATLTLDNFYNTSGGGNPSLIGASGTLNLTGSTVVANITWASGTSAGYGIAAVFW